MREEDTTYHRIADDPDGDPFREGDPHSASQIRTSRWDLLVARYRVFLSQHRLGCGAFLVAVLYALAVLLGWYYTGDWSSVWGLFLAGAFVFIIAMIPVGFLGLLFEVTGDALRSSAGKPLIPVMFSIACTVLTIAALGSIEAESGLSFWGRIVHGLLPAGLISLVVLGLEALIYLADPRLRVHRCARK